MQLRCKGPNKVGRNIWKWFVRNIYDSTHPYYKVKPEVAYLFGSEVDYLLNKYSGVADRKELMVAVGKPDATGEESLAEFMEYLYGTLLIRYSSMTINEKYGCEVVLQAITDPNEYMTDEIWAEYTELMTNEDFKSIALEYYDTKLDDYSIEQVLNPANCYEYSLALYGYLSMDEVGEQVLNISEIERHGIILTHEEILAVMAQYHSYILREI